MDRRIVICLATMALLAACSSGENSTSQSTGQGAFALQSQPAAPGEARVSLRALAAAGPIVTVISELDYDPARLHMKGCELNAAIGDGKTGKALHVAEPSPGVLRAVVAGTLDSLPPTGDIFTCTFTGSGSSGPVTVRAHGEVSDTTFTDRTFVAEGSVNVGN
jgi:hypothetical protein